jgi:Ca2+-binding RTX toxin-like protein
MAVRLTYGTSVDDTIYGDAGDDEIYGLDGHDLIFGENGHDWIYGGNGNDHLFGGIGEDHLYGEAGDDILWGDSGNDTLSGAAGRDYLNGGTGIDAMFGGLDDDWYVVGEAGDSVVEYANQGLDTVDSYVVAYTLPANVEDLWVVGLSSIEGHGNSLNNSIYGNSNDNWLTGGDGDDNLYGWDGNDLLEGGDGFDFLFGEVGDDRLDGGGWLDWMWGGTGNDHYVVDNSLDRAFEAAGEGVDTVESEIRDYTLPDNVENLQMYGAALNGDGNSLNNAIQGNSHDNTLNGRDGDDTLYGNGGNDWLIGGAGRDAMWGGSGDDYFDVDNPGDSVVEYAGEGRDTVISSTTYTLSANVENLNLVDAGRAIDGTGNALNNYIHGNSYHNVLRGEDGDDDLDGSLGSDTMYGGRGQDTFHVDQTGDVVIEYANQGVDRVIATIDYTLGANVENLSLLSSGGAIDGTGNSLHNDISGNAYSNILSGRDGWDWLHGYGGNDALWGDAGDDSLDGGAGADMLYGGTGRDLFIFASAADTTDGVLHDHIIDFSSAEGDRIDLSGIDANSLDAGNQTFAYLDSAFFGGRAGQLCYVGGFLQGDTNGDRVADFMIEVNAFSLSASDLYL